jgi:hypothetical protein
MLIELQTEMTYSFDARLMIARQQTSELSHDKAEQSFCTSKLGNEPRGQLSLKLDQVFADLHRYEECATMK